MAEEFMHKNKLQEYAQKFSIGLPTYHTTNEGTQHAPQFRATVTVDGTMFKSPSTFSNKKAAEQYVAKYALESIISNIKTKGVPVIQNDTIFCKSVLHEYAAKMNMKMPTYETSQEPRLLPAFASTVCFDNKIFKGGIGKSKKEAEQIAARAVIEFILGNSDACTTISQIVKSKDRLYATLGKGNVSSSMPSRDAIMVAPSIPNTTADGMEVQATVTGNMSHDGTATTAADQSIHPEACKQTSELRNANALTLGEAVKNSTSTSDTSRSDIGVPRLQNLAEAKADQCIHPEACKQTSELRNTNALTLGEAVKTSTSTSDASRNDIGVPRVQNLAEAKTEVPPYDAGNPSSYSGVAVPVTVGQNNESQSRNAVIIGPSIPNTSAERKEMQATLSCQMSHNVAYPKSFPEAFSNVAASQSISPCACNQSSDVISNQSSLPTPSNAETVTTVTSTSHVPGYNIGVQHPGEVRAEVPLDKSGETSSSVVMVPTASKKRSRRKRKGSFARKKTRGDEPSNPRPPAPR